MHADQAFEEPRHVAVLLHGLTGSGESPYVIRCAHKLRRHGFHVVRLDLRGHGKAEDLARYPGHAGRSEDLLAALKFLTAKYPGAGFHFVGISLSGNMTLKLLGELARDNDTIRTTIKSAVAISPPIDLVTSSHHMLLPQCRVYARTFVRKLMKIVRRRIKSGLISLELPAREPRNLWEFDDAVTAPLGGFRNALDYYETASSTRVLDGIDIPTLVLAAMDDPIVPGEIFNRDFPSSMTVHVTTHGGHVGFYQQPGATRDADRYWMDWRVVEWLLEHREE